MTGRFDALGLSLTALALVGTLASAQAQTTPAMQVIVPFAAGGGRDGAAGTIGLQAVARAPAEGTTLAFAPAVSITSEPHRHKNLDFELASFRPVC